MFELLTAKLLDDLDAITCANQAYMDIQQHGQPQLNMTTLVELRAHAVSLREQCADLGLLATQDAAHDLVGWLEKAIALGARQRAIQVIPRNIFVRILNHLREVPQIARREAKPRRFFMIAPEHQQFYEPNGYLFTAEVDIAFESIRYDLAEAGKCLALERSTAAVFHLVRCLEGGLRAIARYLGIPDSRKGHDQSWGAILRAIRDEIFRRWPNAADRYAGDGKTFEELHGALQAFKSPFRDGTMHLQEKYTEEEARYFFEMIRGLMTKIAAQMDEKGQPNLP